MTRRELQKHLREPDFLTADNAASFVRGRGMVMNQETFGRGFGQRLGLALIVLLAASGPTPSSGRKPQYPEVNLIKAHTPAGHPYIAGGISFDEKKAMERASAPITSDYSLPAMQEFSGFASLVADCTQ